MRHDSMIMDTSELHAGDPTSMMRPLGKPPPRAMSRVSAPEGMHSLQARQELTALKSLAEFNKAGDTASHHRWLFSR